MPTRPKKAPRKALVRIYGMAREMSNCSLYGEGDPETGQYLGVVPEVERDLEEVRKYLRLPKETG